jgi:hypothetical protein
MCDRRDHRGPSLWSVPVSDALRVRISPAAWASLLAAGYTHPETVWLRRVTRDARQCSLDVAASVTDGVWVGRDDGWRYRVRCGRLVAVLPPARPRGGPRPRYGARVRLVIRVTPEAAERIRTEGLSAWAERVTDNTPRETNDRRHEQSVSADLR